MTTTHAASQHLGDLEVHTIPSSLPSTACTRSSCVTTQTRPGVLPRSPCGLCGAPCVSAVTPGPNKSAGIITERVPVLVLTAN